MRNTFAVLVLALGFAVAGCGGEKVEEEEGVASQAAKAACTGSALADDVSLPASFPEPSEVTYVTSEQQGPTHVVDGRYEGELGDAYEAYKDGLSTNGYSVTDSEQEDDDAEVAWEGQGRSGQVALREECGEEGTLWVHITDRPE